MLLINSHTKHRSYTTCQKTAHLSNCRKTSHDKDNFFSTECYTPYSVYAELTLFACPSVKPH